MYNNLSLRPKIYANQDLRICRQLKILMKVEENNMNISTTLSDSMYNEKNNLINKVPEITILFWIIKILTTGMGEAASDYICHELLGSRRTRRTRRSGISDDNFWRFSSNLFNTAV